MALINILVAVNASELAERLNDGSMQPGFVSNPTDLGAWTGTDVFISMTFDGDSDYTAYLYAGNLNPSASITALSYFNMHIVCICLQDQIRLTA